MNSVYGEMSELNKISLEVLNHFYKRESDDLWFKKDDSPEWVQDMVRDAHGDLFPNNHSYQFIVEALNAFTNYDDPEIAISEIESDPYYSQLIDWLGSDTTRMLYADDGMAENPSSIMDIISYGQIGEKRDVYYSVLKHLNDPC